MSISHSPKLYRNISEQETAHPDAAFIITGDFNKANFRTIAPKYFQHVTINTRGDRTLDHCYSPFRDAYKSLPRPPFGKSDHSSVLLLPAYRQKLKREAPALRTVHCWSDQSDAILQDCFDHVDWDMFRAASDDDIEAYSDTVTCFIRKCIDDVVPTKTIRIYPKQKPWINSDVRSALSARTSAFKSGNTDDRKQASYDLRRSIKAAKRTYKNKVEEQFNNNNPRSMWQGINNITGFKGYKPATVNIASSLPDELNTFYARFEADNTAHTESAHTAAAEEVSPLTLSVADVTRSFKRVNIRSAFNTIVPATLVAKLTQVCSHRRSAEEGTSASLLPETAEEVWNEPQNPQVLLHLHCGEHPDRLHHRLVWKQHRWQPQGSAKGRANCTATLLEVSFPPSRISTPGGVQGKPGGLSKTPATRPTDCSLCCPQEDVSAASDPALAD